MLFVLEFSRETGCSVPRQDFCGLLVAPYYLSFFFLPQTIFLASIPKGNLFVGVSPACRSSSTNKGVENILAMFPAIWTNNVFPSFPEKMRFELSLYEFFPIFFLQKQPFLCTSLRNVLLLDNILSNSLFSFWNSPRRTFLFGSFLAADCRHQGA